MSHICHKVSLCVLPGLRTCIYELSQSIAASWVEFRPPCGSALIIRKLRKPALALVQFTCDVTSAARVVYESIRQQIREREQCSLIGCQTCNDLYGTQDIVDVLLLQCVYIWATTRLRSLPRKTRHGKLNLDHVVQFTQHDTTAQHASRNW